jgi:hypothetical protein
MHSRDTKKDSTDIRTLLGFTKRYSSICREERNYAAILYTALSHGQNVERFLSFCNVPVTKGVDVRYYFEYAFLRDFWNIESSNEKRRSIIRSFLKVEDIETIVAKPIQELNGCFIKSKSPSQEWIQSPGRWSVTKIDQFFKNNNVDFLTACKFKWAFNIKPDIVFEIGQDRAICIEIKYESGEGQYPTNPEEKEIFRRRGIPYVDQTNLQEYMMNELLGRKTEFLFLVNKKTRSSTHKVIKWDETLAALDLTGLPSFQQEMLKARFL